MSHRLVQHHVNSSSRFEQAMPTPKQTQIGSNLWEAVKTGIFQLLPYSAYHRQMNNFQNRLSASVSELDLFPLLG